MLVEFLLSIGVVGIGYYVSSPIIETAGALGALASAYVGLDISGQKKNYKILSNCGLINRSGDIPKIIKRIKSEEAEQIILKLPYGITSEDIQKKINVLSESFKMDLNIIKNNNYTITLENKKTALYSKYEPTSTKGNEVLIAEVKGEPIIVDMNKYPHILIGGDTGTGKSRLLLTILTNLISCSNNIDVHLLQVRKNDLAVFKNCKQIKTYSKTLDEALKCLEEIHKIIEYRESLIDCHSGYYNIRDYNKANPGRKLNYCYIVIDEFSFLNTSKGDTREEKALKQRCMKYIKEVVNAGRSSGIFAITSLQKPTNDSIPTDIKAMLTTRISMHINDMPTSLVILGTDEATRLKDREVIIKTNKNIIATSYTIDHDTVMNHIKDKIVENKTINLKGKTTKLYDMKTDKDIKIPQEYKNALKSQNTAFKKGDKIDLLG